MTEVEETVEPQEEYQNDEHKFLQELIDKTFSDLNEFMSTDPTQEELRAWWFGGNSRVISDRVMIGLVYAAVTLGRLAYEDFNSEASELFLAVEGIAEVMKDSPSFTAGGSA